MRQPSQAGSSLNIRPYEAADLASIVKLFTDAVHIGAARHYDAAQRSAWAPIPADPAFWRERLAKVHTLVAGREAQMLGFISYEDDGHIDLLFTSPAAARQGVATALYERVEAALLAQGVRELFTEASLVARPFFARHGYEVSTEEVVSRLGVELTRFRMRKALQKIPKNILA